MWVFLNVHKNYWKKQQNVIFDLLELYLIFYVTIWKNKIVNNVLAQQDHPIFIIMITSNGKKYIHRMYTQFYKKKGGSENKNIREAHQNMAILGSRITDNWFLEKIFLHVLNFLQRAHKR